MGDLDATRRAIPSNVATSRLIIYTHARARASMKKTKEFCYAEGIYLSALRILRDDLLSIRRDIYSRGYKLIFAVVATTYTAREYFVRNYSIFLRFRRATTLVNFKFENVSFFSQAHSFNSNKIHLIGY